MTTSSSDTLRIESTVVCGLLVNVERLAADTFRSSGYEIVRIHGIRDNGRAGINAPRTWAVDAECVRIEVVR